MATPNVGILTTDGKALIDKVNSGQTKISFSKIVFSSMDNSQLSDMQVKALTTIAPQEVVVSSPETTLDTNSGETRIRATGTNEKLADGVYVKTYGVFAKDDTGSEILYGVTVSPNPNYFPAYDGVTPQAVTYSYKTVIQETSNITMTNSNDVYASQEDLTEALQPYAKTVDVNQQLDKKVNIADMRKPASDVAGIEEVNTKQDKIGYTPADDSKVAHLSGANNFDTVPTVNNNPLLLENHYTVDLTDAKYDRNKWYYVEANSQRLGYLGGPSYFSLEAPLYSGINVPYGAHGNSDNAIKDVCARQTVLYGEGGWGAYDHKLIVFDDQTRWTTDGKRLLTFVVPSDKNLNYAFYVRGGLKINITSDVPGLTWTPHTDTFVENGTTISVLNDAPDPKALGLDDDNTFWALPTSQFNQQLKSYVTAITQLNSTDMNTVKTAGFYKLNSGTNGMPNADEWTIYQVITLSSTNGVQIAYQTNNAILGMRSWDKKTEITFTSWIQFADDSKVAHLSGANNFDTVPTVNNNPLLLASSLPSDLARTGSNQEFTGKNTFDVAPIDKATGNPYITAKKPGIPKLAVKYNATSKAFDYTLTAPEKDGLSDIIQYNLLWKDHSVDGWTTVIVKPDALTGQLTGVDIPKTYDFKASAQNAVGSSDFTDVITLGTVDGNIYGVSWDGSSSGALQRTDAAVGLKAGINGAQNDFDTRGPWGLMDKTVTDSYGNAFVRVPKFYIRKTQNKPLSTWQVSLVKQGDDWYLPNCFYDFDNKKELDYVDVSRYEGFIESGRLKSKSGVNPTANLDISHFRTAATALNVDGKKGYHLWDVHTLDALQVLFTIEFATLDSQSIMKGVTDNVLAGAEATGAADGVKGSSGNVDHSNGYGSMTYRGIENLYGNLAMFTDGLNISNLSLYSCDDATKYASDVFTSPYYKLNYSLHLINGNITGLGFDTEHPGVTAPTSSNNDSYNTYYHDDGYVNGSGNYVAYTGGGWNWDAGHSGLWYWNGRRSSTDAYSNVGSRLLKKTL